MAPAIKVALPTGKIGVSFKGSSTPIVSSVSDDSPMKGKIKAGYKFIGLYLKDGTEYENLGTKDLVEALSDTAEEEGRKIKLQIALPAKTSVTVPPGDAGITVDGDPPTIVQVDRTSPLKDKLRVGLVVDSVELDDGFTVLGHTADEITELLADNEGDERVLHLKNPSATSLSERAVILPEEKAVDIPSGKLGVVFAGFPAKVARMSDASPVRGKFRIGMAVDSFIMPDGTEYSGLSAEELVGALAESVDTEGRKVILKPPTSKTLSKVSTTKVILPAGDLGLTFDGEPAIITEVSEHSTLKDRLYAGQMVKTICLDDGTEYDDLDWNDVQEILGDTEDSTGRWMLLENQEPIIPLPDEKMVYLPTERLGVSFSGTPPTITKIAEESPVATEFMVGLAADTLIMPGGPTYMELSTPELVKLLKDTVDVEGRMITLKNPATTKMTKKPDAMEVKLPKGKLGVVFTGTPPKVTRFFDDSPMKDKLPIGLVVDMLTLEDGTVIAGCSGKELAGILADNSFSSGRTLLLKNPSTRRLSTRQIMPPDEKIVVIPAGSLGVSFKGKHATVSRIQDNSPVKAQFRVGMVVDKLTLPNGSTYTGLSATELVNVLKGSAILEDREVHLVNPDTMELSAKAVVQKTSAKGLFVEDEESVDESQAG
eukprot:CAMPEP_0202494188 /NCGR_PEP_ID=MMETSP1361-20130828/10970_1 /ASSEMBLY_ACC=CAM_ASM_000849 /TAXON_ID=210615 /ORGANISM="Staurosira complex sp., Strain CCMP2646" /LENGTH=654 /DNA_ID=CAMNT_0049124611 /DNA_START=78 /DNA_END=2042 /DNA_ORIENTATION=+